MFDSFVIVLLLLVIVWYFMIYDPNYEDKPEKLTINQRNDIVDDNLYLLDKEIPSDNSFPIQTEPFLDYDVANELAGETAVPGSDLSQILKPPAAKADPKNANPVMINMTYANNIQPSIAPTKDVNGTQRRNGTYVERQGASESCCGQDRFSKEGYRTDDVEFSERSDPQHGNDKPRKFYKYTYQLANDQSGVNPQLAAADIEKVEQQRLIRMTTYQEPRHDFFTQASPKGDPANTEDLYRYAPIDRKTTDDYLFNQTFHVPFKPNLTEDPAQYITGPTEYNLQRLNGVV